MHERTHAAAKVAARCFWTRSICCSDPLTPGASGGLDLDLQTSLHRHRHVLNIGSKGWVPRHALSHQVHLACGTAVDPYWQYGLVQELVKYL